MPCKSRKYRGIDLGRCGVGFLFGRRVIAGMHGEAREHSVVSTCVPRGLTKRRVASDLSDEGSTHINQLRQFSATAPNQSQMLIRIPRTSSSVRAPYSRFDPGKLAIDTLCLKGTF